MTVSSSSQEARFFDPAEDYRHSNFNSLQDIACLRCGNLRIHARMLRRALAVMQFRDSCLYLN